MFYKRMNGCQLLRKFPELNETIVGRFGFHGESLSKNDEVRQKYQRKRLPEEYRKRGASNPVKYSFK